jgi:hypothetical protein
MVSNVLGLSAQELREKLAQFREIYADDPEYQEARSPFPSPWPM